MSKPRIKNQNTKPSRDKNYLVVTKYPENYKAHDLRTNKPVCFRDSPITGGDASMVIQEIDTLELPSKINGKKNSVDYIAPNNVGILLSISNKSIVIAKELFDNHIGTNNFASPEGSDAKNGIITKTRLIYDYIESIQTCIVFGYTALEAFTNLSIPDNYEYKSDPNSKGVIEIYNKEAIERWTSLKVKISDILVDIYKTKNIKGLKLWSNFLIFEELRHDIIHQKTINHTDFYKKYFKKNLFEVFTIPEDVIKFFFDNRQEKEKTNPLWPWIINGNNDFPVSYDFKSKNFEIVGNLYEGFKKDYDVRENKENHR